MFSEYLSAHPLAASLRPAPPLFPSAEDREAWGRIAPACAEEIRAMWDAYRAQPYPMRLATGFLAFARSGSRQADEEPYFFRRRKLCAAALYCCLEENASLDDVIDGLWCVCEESSWVISAHNVNPIPGAPSPRELPLPDVEKPYIDLFAAQTGMILSLIGHLLSRRLREAAPSICQRIEGEIRRRILSPFMDTDDFWWMGFRRTDLCNWTPWIVSNIMVCACLSPLREEEKAALLERACLMLDRWLLCVPQDGGCDEGAGYWNMAGGALLDCLQILEQLTDGQMTFWRQDKVRNILAFPQKAEIGGGWFMNFADCDARPFLSGERLQWAGEKLGDASLAAMGIRLRGTLMEQMSDVPHFSRVLHMLFHPLPASGPEETPGDVWLPDLQARVVRRGDMTLCCKGGHNGESHNHNDVGSFMLYAGYDPQIVDAGNMTYTAKTFSPERYTLWNTRSAYHNVPLIGAWEQRAGREYAARNVHCLPDGLALDLAGAYPEEAGVSSLQRDMRLGKDALTVRDRIVLRRKSPVTWVFLLRYQPFFSSGGFLSGALRAEYPASFQSEAEEIPVADPRMARNFPGSLWRVLVTAPADMAFDATFIFRRNASDARQNK